MGKKKASPRKSQPLLTYEKHQVKSKKIYKTTNKQKETFFHFDP